jgi:hypothetical protein
MSFAVRSSLLLPLSLTVLSACGLFGGAEDHDSQKQAVTYAPGVHLIEHDNPTCASLGFAGFELKVEGNYNATYPLNAYGDSITITSKDGKHFDWQSTIGIDAVISKGGDNAHLYVYDPEATSGANLYSPNNGGGGTPAISHINFCFDYQDRDPVVRA